MTNPTSATKMPRRQESKKSAKPILIGVVVFLVMALLAGLGWFYLGGKTKYDPYPGAAVEIEMGKVPADLKIGVVVSYTEDPSQGSGWLKNAEGVTVANWRIAQAGTNVELVVASDQGSDSGSQEAVKSLQEAGVSAIIATTTGTHTQTLAKAAHDADLGIIFPYQMAPTNPVENSWYGVPSWNEIQSQLLEHSKQSNCQRFYVDSGVLTLEGVEVRPLEFNENGQFTAEFMDTLKNEPMSCMFFSEGSAKTAKLIVSVRDSGAYLPIYMSPEATSADFVKALEEAKEVPTKLYAIGTVSNDITAVTDSSVPGTPSVSFVEAVAQMKSLKLSSSVNEGKSFADNADFADTVSHDAFLALVQAAVEAKSLEPGQVSQSLQGSQAPISAMTEGSNYRFSEPVYRQVEMLELVDTNGKLLWAKSGN